MPGDIDALISDHLDGCLADDDRRTLEAWLAAEPANRRRFLRLVMDHQALGRVAATMAAQPPTLRTRRIRRPRRPQAWLLPLAAALVAAIAGWWLWPGAAPADPAPGVVAAAKADHDGPVLVVAGGDDPTAARRLAAGSTVAAVNGPAILRWADGSEVRLDAGSAAEVTAGVGLLLRCGRLSADIAPQPAGRPARFTTAEAEVIVVGTSLAVSAGAGESAAEVSHGRVRVRRIADGSEVAIGAGECVAVAPGLALRARAIGSPPGSIHRVAPGEAWPDAARIAPGDVVELAPGTHHGAWRFTASGTALRPVTLRGAGIDRTVLDADGVATTGEHAGPRAVLQIEGHDVAIEGLTLSGARNRENAAGIRVFGGSEAITVRACAIRGCDQGLTSDAGSGEMVVADCVITGNGTADRPGTTHNLNLAGRRSEIRGCRIADAGQGVNVKIRGGDCRLVGNRISGGADGEIVLDGDGRLELLGNLVIGTPRADASNRARFIAMNPPPQPATTTRLVLVGCTLVAGDPRNQVIDAPGVAVELTGCIVTGSDHLAAAGTRLGGWGNCIPAAADAPGLSETRRGEPGFRDPAAGDYGLRSDSPCRGSLPRPLGPLPDLIPPGPAGSAIPRADSRSAGACP